MLITTLISTSGPAASNNTIGGTTPGARNVISANGLDGIEIFGGFGGGTGNLVLGNSIGTDVTGTHALGNVGDGIVISSEPAIRLAGRRAGAQFFPCNGEFGIDIEGATSTGVQGNYIGTNATGRFPWETPATASR